MAYHKKAINKGVYGEFSKIKEEFDELEDAFEQGDKVLQICELADLIGAIKGYVNKFNLTIDDLNKMVEKTEASFKDGTRVIKTQESPVKLLKFEKIEYNNDLGWYIVYPNYPGPKEDLQMVAGADLLLDRLSYGKTLVELFVCTFEMSTSNSEKEIEHLIKQDEEGIYVLKSTKEKIWLCEVTKLVFQTQIYPENIYFLVNE